MTIAGVGSSNSNLMALYQQRRQDLQSLENAVKAGDIAGAQQALTSYQKDGDSIQSAQATASSTAGNSSQSSLISGGLAFMISSMEADPTATGQSTFGSYEPNSASQSTFMKDLNSLLEAVQSGNADGAQSAVATLLNDNPQLAAATKQDSTNKSELASMLGAVQSGDIADAQTALTALQQGGSQGGSDASGSGDTSQPPLMKGLIGLIEAVQSGNMTQAQQALAGLQGEAVAHHHHHAASGASDITGFSIEESETQTLAIL